MAELVENRHTGVHFKPGDPIDLAAKIERLVAEPLELQRMRLAARQTYERHYTAESNYRTLMAIYERALRGKLHSTN
jgi:glycosyltransferase involved in cell wall biosynthesis